MDEEEFTAVRRRMVETIGAHALVAREELGKPSLDHRVLEVMAKVPRHEFVPLEMTSYAYADTPVPIGFEKTISQPFMVALMTDLLEPGAEDRVLEVGTGLGYQTAVLAELAKEVWTVEIVEELGIEAEKRLRRLGYNNVTVRVGDGSAGWIEQAPFDKIMVAAAPDLVPPALIHQLKPGGRMVLPAGLPGAQKLVVVDKDGTGRTRTRELLPVAFSVLETVR